MPMMAYCQGWFPDEAVWQHDYNDGFGSEGYVRMVVDGDTIAAGQISRKLSRTREVYNHITTQYSTQVLEPVLAHEAGGIVWVYVPLQEAFDTLYDFHAMPGDHWQLPELPDITVCGPESWMEVSDTGTVVIDGVALRWLAVRVHYLPWAPTIYLDTIIERIGATTMYILPHDFCNGFLDGQEGGALRCYHDEMITYTAPNNPDCAFDVGVDERFSRDRTLLAPNPGGDHVRILADGPHTITFTDMAGRAVLHARTDGHGQVDVSALPPGMYVYTIADMHRGANVHGRWVKE